jgi:biofilm PGA synthesis N-glycosyltransferase PgaC
MIANDSYVLVTAAYNEGKFIEGTVASVIGQELLPKKWIIVSDGSTDGTDVIVRRYAAKCNFIQLFRLNEDHPRNFAAQVNAINAGIAQLRNERYEFIGNLDADISFEPSYFRLLLSKFGANPKLGLAGGAIYDKCKDGTFRNRKTNRKTSVAHAVQVFRRECFKAVGGAYRPLPYGAPDTYAETEARRMGWQVISFPELRVFHHRPTGSAGGLVRSCFRQGRMDFSLGVLPLFEVFKLINRIEDEPYLVGSMARFAGFVYSYCCGERRAVPEQFITYLRQEEKRRLLGLFRIQKGC